jgi:ankyrin repeat protein
MGFTPLHKAASSGHKDVVTLLLSAGASTSVVNEHVIKPSVKLRQLDIKLLQQTTQLYITKLFEKKSVVLIT